MKAKIATFLVMLAFWVIMSGMFDGFHLSLGVVCCLLVAHFSHELLFPRPPGPGFLRQVLGLLLYVPWLFWQILVANLQVTYIVLHPRMLDLIDPTVFRFKTTLKSPFSKVTFAQSITLTPGTITVSVHDDEFAVYALTRSAAESLPGEMERRIAVALEGQS
ncbi:Na+/H+ antiporter subunit E [Desulfuromonas versatilis]|uniref:Na+/H+ antiporter subunit E n=1 Tax=Desulfuromonas versatilis TaxID=2802975 RepID=A0ABM8HVR5_9BACT|nr:Na+/H+ antiporter subunit E [Desulfuromonas versatilis]BCR06991.1 Na+/H+ antiporter subunit E [Desulfuromonas versatilis]